MVSYGDISWWMVDRRSMEEASDGMVEDCDGQRQKERGDS